MISTKAFTFFANLLFFITTSGFVQARLEDKAGIEVVSNPEYQQLQKLAQYAQISYCADKPTFAPFNCRICNASTPLETRSAIFSDNNQFKGFVGVNHADRAIYVAFQGAVNAKSWLESLEFWKRQVNFENTAGIALRAKAEVHDGFLDSYNNIRSAFLSKVTPLLSAYPTYTLHTIGHSFGAALSTLAAVDVALSGLFPACQISLTSFGSPRLGNFEFARWIDADIKFKSVTRFVHSRDSFPHIPSSTLGYRHFGTEYWLDVKTKQVYKCTDIPPPGKWGKIDESESCANSVPAWRWTTDAHNSYYDTTQKTACVESGDQGSSGGRDDFKGVQYLAFEIFKERP
ncbi:hypothetical protein HDV05_004850 [Chytridiales sp. JEL 0842]|nr:hypothetical protein HDV05_004850 [Chytridiales sp. JEL 0842]